MISKIIHYCWFGRNAIPDDVKKNIESWHEKCPEYEIKKWDEDNFDVEMNDYIKEAYSCGKWAFVSDYARLWIIYMYGGIYLDTDVEVISNFDRLLKYDAFFGFEGKKFINTGLGFGATERTAVLKEMMMVYEKSHFIISGKMNTVTCPHITTDVLEKYGIKRNGKMQLIDKIIVLSTEFLCPYDYISKELRVTDKTISIHHYSSSWMNEQEILMFEQQNEYINKYGNLPGKLFFLIKLKGPKEVIKIIISKIIKRKHS